MRTHLWLCLLVLAAPAFAGSDAAYRLLPTGSSATYSSAGPVPVTLQVQATGDLDGDGRVDEGVLRFTCDGGRVSALGFHYRVASPRDSASGQASGKRNAAAMRPRETDAAPRVDAATAAREGGIVREWNPASPQLRAITPSLSSNGPADAQGWRPVRLTGADGLCAALVSPP